MPAQVLTAWERHFDECPPGDYLLHGLLVQLIQLVESVGLSFSTDQSRQVRGIEDIAPWLLSSEQWRVVQNRKQEHAQIVRMAEESGVQELMKRNAELIKARRAAKTEKPAPKRRKPAPKKPATKRRKPAPKRKPPVKRKEARRGTRRKA